MSEVIASALTNIDRNYNSNWVISVDKWDSYRSIGYQGNLDVAPIQAASVIAGGGGFDGSFNVTDASFRTQGDASSNWFSSSHPAQMAFNNDISFVGGQYFAVENVSAYQNGSIVSDSDNSAVKLDFLFPSPRTATEYKIIPPNEIGNNNALYMPNQWCIYGSKSETIDTTLPSTESNGYFLLDSREDAKPWSAHDASLISVSGGKKYIIANPGLYSQYRMSILQNSGDPSGNINIGELIYYEGGVGPLVGGGALDGRSDLSGGLAFHGDVSGINGLEPIIINNYTVDVSLNRFTLNDDLQPELTLYRGETYNFNQSDIDNSGQRLFVSNDSDGRLVASTTYQLLAGGNGSENSNTLRGTGGNDGIVSSNNWSSGYTLSRVFNGTLDNNQDGWHTSNNTYPANLIFTFPNPVVIYKYKVWPRQRPSNYSDTHPPKLWQIRGVSLTNINDYDQNDSSTYTVLHEQNVPQLWNVDWFNAVQTTDITNDTKRQEYIFSTPGLYKHYVFHVIESQYGATSHTFIGEIAYYGGTPSSYSLSDNSAGFITTGTLGTDLSSSWTIPTDAPDTMYYASDGSANAGGIINIANIPNYNIVNLFDGNNNSLYKSPIGAFENYDLSAGKEFAVKFELPSKKKILKYDIKNTNIKSWTLRGCDNSAIYDRNDSNTYELLHGVRDLISPLISDEQTLAGGGALNGTGGDQGLAVDTLDPGDNTQYSTTWTAAKAFNGYDSTPNNQNFWSTNNNTSNNELRFKFPYRVNITRYKLWVRQIAGHPENWEIRGAPKASSYDMNNSSTYDVLDEQTGITGWQVKPAGAIAADTHRKEFIISNTSPFYSNLYEEIIIYLYSSWNEIEELVYIGRIATDIPHRSNIVSNPKDYTYYVLDVSSSNITDSAELGELIYYDTGSYPSAGAGSLDGSSGDVGGLLIHGDVKGVGGQSDWAALSGGLGAHGDISGILGHSDGSFVSNVYDGSNITVYKSPIGAFDNYDLSAGKEFAVKMDFPSSKKILRYDLNYINLKSWTLRGTDNSVNYDRTDSNTYEVLDSNVDFSYVVSNNSGNSGFSNAVDSVLNGDAGLSTLESSITLWIDGTNIDGTNNSSYSNGNNITTWKDLSSKGNDLEPRSNPTFLDNGGPSGSNKAVVNFTDDAFRTSGNIDMNIIFIVHKTKNEDFLFDFRGGNGSYVWTGGGGVSWTVHQNGTNTNSAYSVGSIMNDQWSVTVFVGGSYNAKVYLMGRYSDNERCSGQVAEMIMFDTTLTSQEINIIEYYLAVKWNLTSIGVYDDTGVTYNTGSGSGSNSTIRIISNPKDYTYYVLDSSASNDISSAEIGELIVYESRVKLSHSTSVFNGTLSDASDAFISDSDVFSNNSLTSGSEFSVKFEFPTKKYISTYRIWPQIDGSMNSPSDWYLHGCDVSSLYDRADESTYNVLDVRTGENSWSVTSTSSIVDLSGYNEYTIIDPGNYSYYVLDVSASNNASLCSIGEIAYYESERVDVTTIRDPQPYENHQLAINMGASEETSDWEVGEIIVFNKKLTSEEEERVVSYLENTFYGSDGFEPVGNNRTLRLTRSNLRLPEVYSALDPSSREIEYFNQADYNRIVNMNLSSINYQDISSIPIKTSDLRNRALSTDVSFTTITGVSKGYTPSSIVKLSDFRGATSGGGGGSGGSGIGGVETIYGNYKVHSFINVGTSTFTVTGSITVDILIVGGGAGGYPGGSGAWEGGGGGAGELIFIKDLIMSAGVYTIIVGAGGGGVSGGSTSSGVNGNITQITGEGLNNNNGYIANGGGTGTRGGGTAQNGGSGGGSGHGTSGGSKVGKARSGTPGISHVLDSGESGNPDRDRLTLSTNIVNEEGHFAYSGGYKSSSNIGGGGGGAGQHGAIGSSTSPGGDGKQYDIRTGSVEWYAGGGGGGARTGVDVPGGQGGGGYGGSTGGGGPEPGGPGTANTGGGGGGSVHSSGSNIAGNGGSGILVIRY